MAVRSQAIHQAMEFDNGNPHQPWWESGMSQKQYFKKGPKKPKKKARLKRGETLPIKVQKKTAEIWEMQKIYILQKKSCYKILGNQSRLGTEVRGAKRLWATRLKKKSWSELQSSQWKWHYCLQNGLLILIQAGCFLTPTLDKSLMVLVLHCDSLYVGAPPLMPHPPQANFAS